MVLRAPSLARLVNLEVKRSKNRHIEYIAILSITQYCDNFVLWLEVFSDHIVS